MKSFLGLARVGMGGGPSGSTLALLGVTVPIFWIPPPQPPSSADIPQPPSPADIPSCFILGPSRVSCCLWSQCCHSLRWEFPEELLYVSTGVWHGLATTMIVFWQTHSSPVEIVLLREDHPPHSQSVSIHRDVPIPTSLRHHSFHVLQEQPSKGTTGQMEQRTTHSLARQALLL